MIVTIGGLPGTGTSTVLLLLADKLNAQAVSAGVVFRQLATEYGLSLSEFGKLAEKDEDIDQLLDTRNKKIAKDSGCLGNPGKHLIIEGRLAGRFANADMKVWLKAPIEVRCKRISSRDEMSDEETLDATKTREACEAHRYMKYYSIDLSDIGYYDLVIDSDMWNQHEICSIIKVALDILVKKQ